MVRGERERERGGLSITNFVERDYSGEEKDRISVVAEERRSKQDCGLDAEERRSKRDCGLGWERAKIAN